LSREEADESRPCDSSAPAKKTAGRQTGITEGGVMKANPFRSFSRSLMTASAAANCAIRGVRNWVRDEAGISAIEYALLAALIALAIVGAVTGLSTTMQNVFSDIVTSL
jgi:pilus assembly protein Flp/PilA